MSRLKSQSGSMQVFLLLGLVIGTLVPTMSYLMMHSTSEKTIADNQKSQILRDALWNASIRLQTPEGCRSFLENSGIIASGLNIDQIATQSIQNNYSFHMITNPGAIDLRDSLLKNAFMTNSSTDFTKDPKTLDPPGMPHTYPSQGPFQFYFYFQFDSNPPPVRDGIYNTETVVANLRVASKQISRNSQDYQVPILIGLNGRTPVNCVASNLGFDKANPGQKVMVVDTICKKLFGNRKRVTGQGTFVNYSPQYSAATHNCVCNTSANENWRCDI